MIWYVHNKHIIYQVCLENIIYYISIFEIEINEVAFDESDRWSVIKIQLVVVIPLGVVAHRFY